MEYLVVGSEGPGFASPEETVEVLEKGILPTFETAEGDYVLNDFHFADGESLPELTLHYRTIGQPVRNP